MPRIQPLFAGEAVGAVAGGREDAIDDVAFPARHEDVVLGRQVAERADFSPAAHPQRSSPPSWESAAALTDRNAGHDSARARAEAAAADGLRRPATPAGWPPRGPQREFGTRSGPFRSPTQSDRVSHSFGPPRSNGRSEWAAGGPPPIGNAAPAPVSAYGEGQSVRYSVPTDGTLQFLPGRLEITAGQDTGREIRFVRLPQTEPEITFGRNEGAPYRHVQLRDVTVSRLHARLRMYEGRWTLTNLSTTNPVTYNGRVLGDGEEQPLEHDDRIEMGEVAFRFRSR